MKDNTFNHVIPNAVIIADCKKFCDWWSEKRICSYDQYLKRHGDVNTFLADSKYQYAVKGFSHGEKNPVPLAQISLIKTAVPVIRRFCVFWKRIVWYEPIKYLSITDGITRTKWLITNGADAFPVNCSIELAEEIQALIGAPGWDYKRLII